MMQLMIRPFATIRDRMRNQEKLRDASTFGIELPPGSCVKDLLRILSLDSETGIVAVSDGKILKKDDPLYQGQKISLFPYLSGG